MCSTRCFLNTLGPVVYYKVFSKNIFTNIMTPNGVKVGFLKSTPQDGLCNKNLIHFTFPINIFFHYLEAHVIFYTEGSVSLRTVLIFSNDFAFDRSITTQ